MFLVRLPCGVVQPLEAILMHILGIVSGGAVNGATVHVVLLYRGLIANGHRVSLLCRPNTWAARRLAAEGVAIIESDLSLQPMAEARRIAGLARLQEVDAIHSHMSRSHNFSLLLRWHSSIAWVATAHTHTWHFHWLLADRVIAVSNSVRRFLMNYALVHPKRIDTVHNSIDWNRFGEALSGQ